jgi:uncharacterized protein YceK
MKKIIIILLCIAMCVILSGCTQVYKSEQESSATSYAMIIMPDGSIIEGEFNALTRISNGYAMIKIDGIRYYTNEWRIVIWEKDI